MKALGALGQGYLSGPLSSLNIWRRAVLEARARGLFQLERHWVGTTQCDWCLTFCGQANQQVYFEYTSALLSLREEMLRFPAWELGDSEPQEVSSRSLESGGGLSHHKGRGTWPQRPTVLAYNWPGVSLHTQGCRDRPGGAVRAWQGHSRVPRGGWVWVRPGTGQSSLCASR